MLLLASLLYMCHIMNDIAKNLGINLAPLGSVYNTPKGVTVRPQLSAEVCASAPNLPMECFQNLVKSFYW